MHKSTRTRLRLSLPAERFSARLFIRFMRLLVRAADSSYCASILPSKRPSSAIDQHTLIPTPLALLPESVTLDEASSCIDYHFIGFFLPTPAACALSSNYRCSSSLISTALILLATLPACIQCCYDDSGHLSLTAPLLAFSLNGQMHRFASRAHPEALRTS